MSAASRLQSFKHLLAHVRELAGLDLGFVLWDGTTVPADLAPGTLAISIGDEGAVSGLLRRPNIDTLVNLWTAKRVDIRNGTVFDLAGTRTKLRTRDIRKAIDKRLAFSTLAKFLFVPRGGPWPLETIPHDAPSDGSAEQNKKNIGYHYDVSNAFYELWLDKEMVYTCAYCTDWNNDIDRMQRDKMELVCRKLRLKPGERYLDIGCGWGSLLIYAAQNYGVTGYGVTLSEQQVAYGQEKIRRLGLEDKVRIELRDYSTVEGEFDKVSALGIQEHLGLDNHTTYYQTVKRVLKRDGLFLHHAITRPAKKTEQAFRHKRPEFAVLTKYIFPGGELDHIGNTVTNLQRNGFEVHDVEALREHYQRTCKHWHDRLLANYDASVKLVGEVKTRMWLLYLGACSISFARNTVGLYQTLASKKRHGPSGLPPTRADLYR